MYFRRKIYLQIFPLSGAMPCALAVTDFGQVYSSSMESLIKTHRLLANNADPDETSS